MSRGRGQGRRGGTSQGWARIRKQVLERDMGVCHLCGGEGANSVDHLIPFSQGGGDNLDNLAAAHQTCNSRRGARFWSPVSTPPTPLSSFSPRASHIEHVEHWSAP